MAYRVTFFIVTCLFRGEVKSHLGETGSDLTSARGLTPKMAHRLMIGSYMVCVKPQQVDRPGSITSNQGAVCDVWVHGYDVLVRAYYRVQSAEYSAQSTEHGAQ